MFGFLKNRRRRKLISKAFDNSDVATLRRFVPPYTTFNNATHDKFEACVKVMLAEQNWEGCDGLTVTREMKLAISGSASLMCLGHQDYYFETVPTILIYSRPIVRSQHGSTSVRVGEAWQFGPIILSWSEIVQNASWSPGRNVVIHEFAHHLDGLDGEMGGVIPFKNEADQQEWQSISKREFDLLVSAAESGQATLLDHYGAESRAEFFAVASECFFEQPALMLKKHSELFNKLVKFYQTDPNEW